MEYNYLVVQFWQDEDGIRTHKWLCATLQKARHIAEGIGGNTTIYELKEVC